MKGWQDNGVRERIDGFMERKLEEVMRRANVTTTKLSLVHGDFSAWSFCFTMLLALC